MREILFRAKKASSDEWVDGDLLHTEKNFKKVVQVIDWTTDPYIYEVKKHTIGQYTGVKDRNGVKIFEGDIIEYKLNGKLDKIGCVVYKDCQFYVKDKLGKGYRLVDLDKGYSIEVIGNIHDKILKFNGFRYPELDIIRVYNHIGQRNILSMKTGSILWERNEFKEVTLQEIADKFEVDIKSLKIVDK